MIDTLVLAGRNDDGGGLTRDDRCSRYGVNSLRSKHDALLDAKLLAAVYGEPTTTRLAVPQLEPITAAPSDIPAIVRPRPLPPRVTTDDRNARREFVRTLGRDAVCLNYFEGRHIKNSAHVA